MLNFATHQNRGLGIGWSGLLPRINRIGTVLPAVEPPNFFSFISHIKLEACASGLSHRCCSALSNFFVGTILATLCCEHLVYPTLVHDTSHIKVWELCPSWVKPKASVVLKYNEVKMIKTWGGLPLVVMQHSPLQLMVASSLGEHDSVRYHCC